MKPIVHLATGVALGGLIYGITRNLCPSVWGCVAAIGSDVDHLSEYGAYCIINKKQPRLDEFFSGKYFEDKGTIVLFLHGLEYEILLFLAWILVLLNKLPSAIFLVSILVGYGSHLALDSIGNNIGFFGYSLLYRWHFGFSEKRLCHRN